VNRAQPIPDGFLLVDKPAGITSFRVVDRVKKRFHIAKLGHGGSLDPPATGLLVLLVNRATKRAGLLLGGEKEYRAVVRLGVETDTQDLTGRVLETVEGGLPDRAAVERALEGFRGEIEQVPPMVSALKHRGERLYKIARRGEEVVRPPRKVTISRLELTGFAPDRLSLEVRCSKGTYIRTLAHDLGRVLGPGGCLEELRRTAVGPFRVDRAAALDRLLEGTREDLAEKIIPLPVVEEARKKNSEVRRQNSGDQAGREMVF
jgi:tRNA pseudouridine55 synthase